MNPEYGYLLLKDVDGFKKSTGGVFKKLIQGGTPHQAATILRGELAVVTKQDDHFNYQLWRDSNVLFYAMEDDIAPLNEDDFHLMEGIKKPIDRMDAFNSNKLELGLSLKEGSQVYIKLPSPNLAVGDCARGVVHYKGKVGNLPGTQFGVEIMSERYRTGKYGTTDGTIQNKKYFECSNKCGLFVSIDRLSHEYIPGSAHPEALDDNKVSKVPKGKDHPYSTSAAKSAAQGKGNGTPSQNTRSKIKESSVDSVPYQHQVGQRVVFYDKKGVHHYGTVRWNGKKKDYNIVGIETVDRVYQSDFENSVTGMEQTLPSLPKNCVLFLPETLVDADGSESKGRVAHPELGGMRLTTIAKDFNVTHTELMKQQEEGLEQAKKLKREKVSNSSLNQESGAKVMHAAANERTSYPNHQKEEYERSQAEAQEHNNLGDTASQNFRGQRPSDHTYEEIGGSKSSQLPSGMQHQHSSTSALGQQHHLHNTNDPRQQQQHANDPRQQHHVSASDPRQQQQHHPSTDDQRQQYYQSADGSRQQYRASIEQHHPPSADDPMQQYYQSANDSRHASIDQQHHPSTDDPRQQHHPLAEESRQQYNPPTEQYPSADDPNQHRHLSSDDLLRQPYESDPIRHQHHASPRQPHHYADLNRHPPTISTRYPNSAPGYPSTGQQQPPPSSPRQQLHHTPSGHCDGSRQPLHRNIDGMNQFDNTMQIRNDQQQGYDPQSHGSGMSPGSQYGRNESNATHSRPNELSSQRNDQDERNPPRQPHQGNQLAAKASAIDPSSLNLSKGSLIQIPSNDQDNPLRYGTIKWIGLLPNVQGQIAGIELEEPMDGCTDGTWQQTSQKFFNCPEGTGIYYPLGSLKPDERYSDNFSMEGNPLKNVSEFAVEEDVQPANIDKYIGDEKGIQGHQNSCYLDATVFGLFALTIDFDEMFLRVAKNPDNITGQILWKSIVNPLRKHGVVRYESVMRLREQLDQLGKMKGITQDEKDPEEFLNMMFKHTLKIPPFISIRRPFGVEEEYFVQLFLEIDEKSSEIPTVGDLLNKMFTEQQISFTKVPSKLLIQVPRFGKKFKMFQKLIPALSLNVATNVDLENTSKCFICEVVAKKICRGCASDFTTNRGPVPFCEDCIKTVHKHSKRQNEAHEEEWCREMANLIDISELELLSVICIETSHYVCFTRQDKRWIFFDSMANRVYDKYNIPRVVDCTTDLNQWVYPENKDLTPLLKTPPRELPEYVRRFTQDIYMCVYTQFDTAMY